MNSNQALNKIIEHIGTHQDKELSNAINVLRQLQEAVDILYDVCPHSAKMLYKHGKISYDDYILLSEVLGNE